MHPKVRDLYKRFIVAGKGYPHGLDHVKERVKKEFAKKSQLDFVSNEIEFKKAIALGRYWVREIMAISKLHKYRAMKRRYYD